MRLSGRLLIVAAALVIAIVGGTYQFFHSSIFTRIVTFSSAAPSNPTPSGPTPSLPAYGVDLQQTSVSGVSAGAGMAVQMHVAYSSIMRGVGVIAGVAYDCADSRLLTVEQRVLRGLSCIDGAAPYGGSDGAAFSIARTTDAANVPGAIDDPAANLPRQKVWLFSGYNDGEVRRAAMDAVALYYAHYTPASNIFYKTNNKAPHALVTDNYGGPCLAVDPGFINNCGYDSAGRLLEHIYGHLNPRSATQSGTILAFDQSQFTEAQSPADIALADTGYVYVPATCNPSINKPATCRVHVVFHGCLQYAGLVGDAVYRHAGYNEWADTNNIIILYPQTTKTDFNPKGCFDWWGLSDTLSLNADFARKTGYQISAFKAMLDRLAQNFSPLPGSDTFGVPQDFAVPDGTATSVDLVWKPNSVAAGFNVYRSSGNTAPYAKLNNAPVQGASFVDQPPASDTTYYYQVKAVDQNGTESGPSASMAGATTSQPPACDPYFSNNMVHVANLRAYIVLLQVFALGSNDALGPYDDTTFNELIREGPLMYRKGYCP
jgi:poly(3-hydroxybutyrate) depolymerase